MSGPSNHARLRDLAPSSFAMVMATGILSVGLDEVGLVWASRVLLAVALLAYLVLTVLYVLRLLRFGARVRQDSHDPAVSFGYFTIVAGTGVLAVGLRHEGWNGAAVALVAVAVLAWLVLGYLLPWQVVMNRKGASILPSINGSWFVWCVASQSVAVALTEVHALLPGWELPIGFLAVLAWSVGALLYAGIAVLVILRLVHLGLSPAEFEPPYWVAMGALAISVVAGAGIVEMPSTPIIDAARGLIGGTVVIFWCCAAWIMPMLVGAGIWRHLVHRVPLRYTTALWSLVFPLGMFAHASMRLGRVESIPTIDGIGRAFLWVALAAWAAVGAGFLLSARTSGRANSATSHRDRSGSDD